MHRVTALVVPLLALLALGAGPAAALLPEPTAPDLPGAPAAPTDPAAGPWFAAEIDWDIDSPDAYRDRLGLAPAAYGWEAPLPLTEETTEDLGAALRLAAEEGAGLFVTLLPEVDVTEVDVVAAVDALEEAGVGGEVPVWLRPYPEMNGNWYAWGQRPADYTKAFRALADEVHARLDGTAMVWQPTYAAGYPFAPIVDEQRDVLFAGPAAEPGLDTNGDGELTFRDDPYGPYWPGDDAVDWVGAPLFHWGDPYGDPDLPPVDDLLAQLRGDARIPEASRPAFRDLVGRFATAKGKPLLLETAALHAEGDSALDDAPLAEGEDPRDALLDPARDRGDEVADERATKLAWFEQVADPRVRRAAPTLGMVLWLEWQRPEREAQGRVVDWRATWDPVLAEAFLGTVEDGGFSTGPVGADDDVDLAGQFDLGDRRDSTPAEDPASVDPGAAVPDAEGAPVGGQGTTLRGTTAWLAAGGTLLVGLLLVALARSRRADRWAYDDVAEGPRDRRLDVLLGLAVSILVVNHVGVPSALQVVSQEGLGPFSGTGLLLVVLGAVVGVVHRPRAVDLPTWSVSTGGLWRRAGRLWAVVLVTVLGVYVVSLVPGIDARVLTSFVDQGADGTGGATVDLYAGIDGLTAYPVPDGVLADLLLLRLGPTQTNVLGLLVVLLLLAPLALGALVRGWWAGLLTVSLGLWALNLVRPTSIVPSRFEDPFPLLSWQVLLVLGLVAGWHRTELVRAARSGPGRLAVAGVAVVSLLLLVVAHADPRSGGVLAVHWELVDDATYLAFYDDWLARTDQRPLRLLAVVAAGCTLYALLTRLWRPLARTVGVVLEPLGRAWLPALVAHLVLVVAVANLPEEVRTSTAWGTAVHVLVLAGLWLLARQLSPSTTNGAAPSRGGGDDAVRVEQLSR